MAASKRALAWTGWLALIVGVIVALAGLMGRAFEAEYGGTVEGEMLVPNLTIAIGLVLVGIGVVRLVMRYRDDR